MHSVLSMGVCDYPALRDFIPEGRFQFTHIIFYKLRPDGVANFPFLARLPLSLLGERTFFGEGVVVFGDGDIIASRHFWYHFPASRDLSSDTQSKFRKLGLFFIMKSISKDKAQVCGSGHRPDLEEMVGVALLEHLSLNLAPAKVNVYPVFFH